MLFNEAKDIAKLLNTGATVDAYNTPDNCPTC